MVRSKRYSKHYGILVKPIRRYFGTKYTALATRAKAEVTSQGIMVKPFLSEEPLIPIKCSVEILVKSIEPAITTSVRLRPLKNIRLERPKFSLRNLSTNRWQQKTYMQETEEWRSFTIHGMLGVARQTVHYY